MICCINCVFSFKLNNETSSSILDPNILDIPTPHSMLGEQDDEPRIAAPGGYKVGEEQLRVIRDIMKDYDWRVRPNGEMDYETGKHPVHVEVNMYLRTISKVDDVNMEYSLHFTFREIWYDDRLAFGNFTAKIEGVQFVNLPPTDPDIKIWMPDTFFQNEKAGKKHMIDAPNIIVRIYPDGRVLYSIRMTLTLSCPMGLQSYPLDTQQCFIELASYAYTTDDIIYSWKVVDPVQVKEGLNISLPSFTLSQINTTECSSKTNTGEYSCQRLILYLKREFSYYLLQLYIPSFMLVAVSWVSFWLDKDSVPARVTLGVTTLLTMTTQASGINAKLPPVSYTKAIDVWIGVCLAFIFGALLEFALVNYAARKDLMEEIGAKRKERNTLFSGNHPIVPYNFNMCPRKGQIIARRPGERSSPTGIIAWFFRKYRARSKRIDVIARFLFPTSFIVFNVVYWVTYLVPYMRAQVAEMP